MLSPLRRERRSSKLLLFLRPRSAAWGRARQAKSPFGWPRLLQWLVCCAAFASSSAYLNSLLHATPAVSSERKGRQVRERGMHARPGKRKLGGGMQGTTINKSMGGNAVQNAEARTATCTRPRFRTKDHPCKRRK
ncbi:hypothetical protein ABZP36_032329 [Zizania latifolia]